MPKKGDLINERREWIKQYADSNKGKKSREAIVGEVSKMLFIGRRTVWKDLTDGKVDYNYKH